MNCVNSEENALTTEYRELEIHLPRLRYTNNGVLTLRGLLEVGN